MIGKRVPVYDRTDKAVCKRCHIVMNDLEPNGGRAEFYHPAGQAAGRPVTCKNAGKTFTSGEAEIVPFVRKGLRRAIKRASAHR